MAKEDPEATTVRGNMLIGVKGTELPSHLRKWKGRLVAAGNNVRTTTGEAFEEEELFGAPTNLDAVRLVFSFSTLRSDSALMCGDVTAAYLQALLGGVPVYMLIPMSLWPQWWVQQHFYQPVVHFGESHLWYAPLWL